MKLGVKFTLTTTILIIILGVTLELVSLFVFAQAMDNLNRKLFGQRVEQLILLAYEQDELFFEGVYKDAGAAKFRVIDKLRIDYRNEKDFVTFPFIANSSGKIILHPILEKGKQYFNENVMRQILGSKKGEFEYTHDGIKKWYVYKIYEPWDWVFCMSTSVQKKNEPIMNFIKASLVISAVIILLSIFIVLFLSQIHIRPLNKVIERLQKISRGETDLSQKLEINTRTSDEIGMLSDAFNKMSEDLSKVSVSRDYFDNIISSMTDILIVLDPEGKITTDNKAVFDHLGYSEDELIGKDISLLFPEEEEEEEEEEIPLKGSKLEKLIKEGSIINFETHLHAKNGTKVPVLLSGAVMKDNVGDITHIVCIAKDITELKKSELALKKVNQDLIANEKALKNIMFDLKKVNEELKNTQTQLVQSEKLASLGQLSAGIAHEINNPLGFITNNIVILEEYIESYSEILRAMEGLKKLIEDRDLDQAILKVKEIKDLEEKVNLSFITGDIDNLIRQSKSGAERIKKIVQDLRTFARKDEGQMELNNIEEILDGIINIVWNEIKYTAELKKEYGGIPLVKCNAQKLGQVFINLLVNSAQAIKEKGEITIKTYIEKKNACIEVSDTGCGISQENIDKIFDPFFTTKEVGKGTGLGLSIGYDIIKQHKGEMEVASEINKGTKFIIKLPI